MNNTKLTQEQLRRTCHQCINRTEMTTKWLPAFCHEHEKNCFDIDPATCEFFVRKRQSNKAEIK